jgi:hypothetical protein
MHGYVLMFKRKIFIAALIMLATVFAASAQTKATDTVMVLPFENASNKPGI